MRGARFVAENIRITVELGVSDQLATGVVTLTASN